jgi:hypothetical protein
LSHVLLKQSEVPQDQIGRLIKNVRVKKKQADRELCSQQTQISTLIEVTVKAM